MASSTTGSLSATGSVTLSKNITDTLTVVLVGGTYAGVSLVFEGTIDGTNWCPVSAVRYDTGAVVTGTVGPADDAELLYKVPSEGLSGVRARVTAIGSGTADFRIESNAYGLPVSFNIQQTVPTSIGDVTFTGTVTMSGAGTLVMQGTGSGVPEVQLLDNAPDALSICIDGGNDFVVFDTTNSDEKLYLAKNSGMKLSFFNVTPAARPGAYTQTYSTADKTHANPTAATLTVADGAGTNDGTIGAITADASVIAAVQELADQINKLIADHADTKQLANSIIDDLQSLGLLS